MNDNPLGIKTDKTNVMFTDLLESTISHKRAQKFYYNQDLLNASNHVKLRCIFCHVYPLRFREFGGDARFPAVLFRISQSAARSPSRFSPCKDSDIVLSAIRSIKNTFEVWY